MGSLGFRNEPRGLVGGESTGEPKRFLWMGGGEKRSSLGACLK